MTPVRLTAFGGVLVLVATLFQFPAHAQQARFDDRVSGEPVRILPLGDSMTHGSAGDKLARGGGEWKVVRRLGSVVRRARITGLRPGTRQRIQVRAVAKDRLAGRWSRTVTVKTRR